jgi:hypothetical protein
MGVTVSWYSPSELHHQAAPGAEGQPLDVVVLRRVLARAVHGKRRLLGIAHRQPADLLRRRHVGLDQRGGDAKRPGDVVEAGSGIVRRQVLRRVDVQIQQVADHVLVFGAVQPVQARRGRIGPADAIQVGLERGDHRLEGGRIRALHRRRRHHARAQLAHHELPRLGVLRDVGGVQRLDGQLARRVHAGRLRALAVAGHAVRLEERALLVVADRRLRRHRGPNETRSSCGRRGRASTRGRL